MIDEGDPWHTIEKFKPSESKEKSEIKKTDVPWSQVKTLEQVVIRFFERKETSTIEFQALLNLYGREKLERIWRNYKEGVKKNENIRPD